ncbi:MAG: hypothetical protein R2828_19810 [Saprospiraceae bacterium]
MDFRTNCLCFLLGICFPCFLFSNSHGKNHTAATDSVQSVLQALSISSPAMVSFIPETQRWSLKQPQPEAIEEALLLRLQDAFFHDFNEVCRFYGWRYLASWRTLMAKAARESFWGTSYLCNRTYNYFGIRTKAKPWMCESFGYCETVERNDPDLAAFTIFPNFEASLWMFIHTMYSTHYLERLPDMGSRVMGAIEFERRFGFHYWEGFHRGFTFPQELGSKYYSIEEIIATWSGHDINNLCVNCSRESDLLWVEKVNRTAGRIR